MANWRRRLRQTKGSCKSYSHEVMNAALPANKTKIVATIGPASESPDVLARLIRAGLDVARLNFSHGSPAKHAEVIQRIRNAARETGRRVAIMADLPGPKLRLGK